MHRPFFLIPLALLSSCSAARPPAARAEPLAAQATPPSANPTEDEWAPLTWEERHDTMTWSLLPAMMPVFQKTFATALPKLNCRTCHGQDAERVQYRMPNGLPALDPAHLPTGHVADAMRNEVTPLLTQILGKPETCFSCHPSTGST